MITSIKIPLIPSKERFQYRINRKNIAIYALIYFLILSLLLFSFLNLFDLEKLLDNSIIVDGNNTKTPISIIINNMKNYAGYVLLYPIYPLLIFLDLMFTSWSMAVSVHAQGAFDTFILLAPHGIFEIPNFILYTYLSCSSFYYFYRTKNPTFKGYFQDIYKKKKLYIISFIIVILAGAIEGIITPLL